MDGATFAVREGSVTALIGPNGAGKTTAFNLVTGFVKAEGGTVTFDGRDISGQSPDVIARPGHGPHVPAHPGPGEDDRARERHARGARTSRASASTPRSSDRGAGGAREAEVREEALEMLGEVGIETHAEEYAATLSGGQRKLLELARALMTRPRLVLLDEPMAGVNPTLGHRLLDYLQRLREERGLTVLFVEHDMDVVMGVSEEVIVMAAGDGHRPRDARAGPHATPRVIDAYLGAEPAARA